MPTFIVLHIPKSPPGARTEGDLGQRIPSLPSDAHMQLEGVWLLRSKEMADAVRDRLSAGLPAGDVLVVFEIGEQAAWRGLTSEQGEWLVSHIWVANRFERGEFITLSRQ